MSYVVVGAGGTGSFLIPPLFRYLETYHNGEFRIKVLDGDQVEAKNLDRQIFDFDTILQNKVDAVLKPYASKKARGYPVYLSRNNIEEYIKDGDTVLICVDNFVVRAAIEDYVNTLENCIVINGGNEDSTGSCQTWIRKDGINLTPAISFLHPEIRVPDVDRAALSCQQAAALPGGEQLIIANMASALYMLTALMKIHREDVTITELHFDLFKSKVVGLDRRDIPGWDIVYE
jgi:molybdopterin/thiamine biosynthesis adenylyltransferase